MQEDKTSKHVLQTKERQAVETEQMHRLSYKKRQREQEFKAWNRERLSDIHLIGCGVRLTIKTYTFTKKD